jgi:hypothetical protein
MDTCGEGEQHARCPRLCGLCNLPIVYIDIEGTAVKCAGHSMAEVIVHTDRLRGRKTRDRDLIEYPPGIPRWFTYLSHRINRRRCAKRGHVLTEYSSCDYCGLYVSLSPRNS